MSLACPARSSSHRSLRPAFLSGSPAGSRSTASAQTPCSTPPPAALHLPLLLAPPATASSHLPGSLPGDLSASSVLPPTVLRRRGCSAASQSLSPSSCSDTAPENPSAGQTPAGTPACSLPAVLPSSRCPPALPFRSVACPAKSR